MRAGSESQISANLDVEKQEFCQTLKVILQISVINKLVRREGLIILDIRSLQMFFLMCFALNEKRVLTRNSFS